MAYELYLNLKKKTKNLDKGIKIWLLWMILCPLLALILLF